MVDILNLALPYFGLIFIGFACGKTRGLPESGLAWMNFFLLYVSLPALLFGIMAGVSVKRRGFSRYKIAKTTPCKVEMGPGSQALGPFASALADALPGRRQPLAHREPPQRAERTKQVHAGRAQRLHA